MEGHGRPWTGRCGRLYLRGAEGDARPDDLLQPCGRLARLGGKEVMFVTAPLALGTQLAVELLWVSGVSEGSDQGGEEVVADKDDQTHL